MFQLDGPIRLKGEIGAVEAITAGTAASVAVSAAFNLGYFSTLGESLVAWMSVQDLFFGAAAAFIPTMLFAQFFAFTAILLSEKPDLKKKIVIGVSISLVFVLLLSVVTDNIDLFQNSRLLGKFITYFWFSLFFGLLFALGAYNIQNAFGITVAVLAAFSLPYNLGKAFYFNDLADFESRVSIETENEQSALSGRILRTTSTYTFLFDGTNVIAIRNEDIKTMLFSKAKGYK